MWVEFIKGAFALGALAVMMWMLSVVLGPLTDTATSGAHADHQTVTQVSTMFDVLTLENLTLLAGIAVGLYLLYQATLQRQGF